MNFFTKDRVEIHEKISKNVKVFILISSLLSLTSYSVYNSTISKQSHNRTDEMIQAFQIMKEAINTIREYRIEKGIQIDETIDPNKTGLIGPEYSTITTTVGHLKAKRTSTNPDIAALIVKLLQETGIEKGDTIAIGSSASFPALMIASLAAAKTLNIFPIVIISLGASSFGATDTEFNLLDIYNVLLNKKIFSIKPSAVSLGGGNDIGTNFDEETKIRLINQINQNHISLLYEPNLQKNVEQRLKIYMGEKMYRNIRAFINAGGNYANMGTSDEVLNLEPGLTDIKGIPKEDEMGVIYEMAVHNIPVIHLLYIKGLTLKYGIPWDPIPLPQISNSLLYNSNPINKFNLYLLSVAYLVILTAFSHFLLKKSK